MTKKPLYIVSDYGLDDACALVYLLLTAQELASELAVVCVAGNSSQEVSLLHAKRLVARAKAEGLGGGLLDNLVLVDTCGVRQKSVSLASVHGADGMGDLWQDVPKTASVPYDEWVKRIDDDAMVLSLAPCTLAVDVVKRLRRADLVIMAGTVHEPPNYMGREFNESLDPEAFGSLVQFPHRIATLDTCKVEPFNLSGAGFEGNGLFATLLNKTIQLASMRHPSYVSIYDLIAAVALIKPQWFVAETAIDQSGNRLNQLKNASKDFRLYDYLKGLV